MRNNGAMVLWIAGLFLVLGLVLNFIDGREYTGPATEKFVQSCEYADGQIQGNVCIKDDTVIFTDKGQP